ncbi:MAG: hypothetical protein ACLTMP_12265 [Eggerthella lenta]
MLEAGRYRHGEERQGALIVVQDSSTSSSASCGTASRAARPLPTRLGLQALPGRRGGAAGLPVPHARRRLWRPGAPTTWAGRAEHGAGSIGLAPCSAATRGRGASRREFLNGDKPRYALLLSAVPPANRAPAPATDEVAHL